VGKSIEFPDDCFISDYCYCLYMHGASPRESSVSFYSEISSKRKPIILTGNVTLCVLYCEWKEKGIVRAGCHSGNALDLYSKGTRFESGLFR
jgi:hypothetical protein